jgi:NTP pyrophosphatase (non-canonical NTP hydrolase)
MLLKDLITRAHSASYSSGWWHDPDTGYPLLPNEIKKMPFSPAMAEVLLAQSKYVAACKLALVHSEISEAMEGHRKDAMDDKLPHHMALETELADAVIRIADLAGALRLDLVGAIEEKMKFNAERDDHKTVTRRKPGGKKY